MLKSSPKVLQAARDLRKRQTEAEKILWNILRDRKFKNFKFRRQHPFGRFIADFYCHKANLIIEIDGPIHNSKNQKEYDILRTKIIKQYGLRVLRFKNEEIISNIKEVLKNLTQTLS
ncbi:MAG: endonuclease domain-containing protein [Candidatus Parcubacteria bacterium]|nr:endonuclease domain-containing protein [Candidatus Parcubacteria bacterium]